MADEFDDIMGDPKPASRKKAADEPRLHDVLSNEEYRAAQAKARERLDKERREAAMKDVEKREISRLKYEDGLVSGIGYLDEIVDVTMDLPPYAPYIAINGVSPGHGGRVYHHGKTYQVPRHVAESLRETMFRMWKHEDQIEGKDLVQQYAKKRGTVINARTGATQNAPVRFDA